MKKRKFALSLTREEMLYGWVYFAVELLLLPSLIYGAAEFLWIRSEAVLNFIYYLCNFSFCLWIFRPLLRQSLTRAGQHPGTLVGTVLAGFVLYFCSNYLLNAGISSCFPDFFNVNDSTIAGMYSDHPFLIALGVVVLAPVAEECLFRGLLFVPVVRKNRTAAFVLSTLAFCAIHVAGYVGLYPAATLAVCFLQYIPAGLCLCWACYRSGSLFAPILIHAAINLVSVLSLG